MFGSIAIAALLFKEGSSIFRIKPESEGSKFLLRPLYLFKRASDFDDCGGEQKRLKEGQLMYNSKSISALR